MKKYLSSLGINESRLETDGKGSKEPLFNSLDEESSSKNRRTEFEVIK